MYFIDTGNYQLLVKSAIFQMFNAKIINKS